MLFSFNLIFRLISSRPFVTSSFGSLDSLCTTIISDSSARAEINVQEIKEDVSAVDQCSTSVIDAPSTQRQIPNQKQTDFIKDEYLFLDTFDNKQYFTDDYHEYEQGQAQIIVKGRLKTQFDFWKSICTYEYILDTIWNGYRIPFYTPPSSVYLLNNRSALHHSDFVIEAIHDLLIRGLIVECNQKPVVVNPLTVSVQSNSKKRLILDLRHVNKHLWKTSVKFEDIRTAM